MVEVIHTGNIKARKQHTCSWCHSLIKKGQVYKRDTCVCDGILYYWLSCGRCQKYVDEMFQKINLDEEVNDEDLELFCLDKYGKKPKDLIEEEL